MSDTRTLTEKAVVGRRIEFTYYRDLPDGPPYPAIITGTEPGADGSLMAVVRLDGKRSTLSIPVDYQGLRYLEQVVPVPELPSGPFIPTADYPHPGVLVEKAGVLVTAVGEDGGDLIAITTDPVAAAAAIRVRAAELGFDVDYLDFDRMQPCWGVFDWEPYDPASPWAADDWFVRWDATEGDENAVHIFQLPVE